MMMTTLHVTVYDIEKGNVVKILVCMCVCVGGGYTNNLYCE